MITFQDLTARLLRESTSTNKDIAFYKEMQTNTGLMDLNRENLYVGLRLAAALEFATVPPYLVALWSIIDEKHPVASSIRAIVHEEMLHMALVNNVLSAIGGTPSLTAHGVPKYPGLLPGAVHPEITLTLNGLTSESVDIFLEIERPINVVNIEGVTPAKASESDTTIGEFYAAVLIKLGKLNPTFSVTNQVSGPLAPMVISGWTDLENAFQLILTQGEGSSGSPFDTNPKDLSHYYRFLQIRLGCSLEWDASNKILRRGEAIAAPFTYPVASPPVTGWGRASSKYVRELSRRFNTLYSELLDELQLAWTPKGHQAFLKAMERMFDMREIARAMIREPGPGGYGHAPEFLYLSPDDRRLEA